MDLTGDLARKLLDASPDATVIVDSRGVVVFTNALVQKTFGYEPAEIIGQPIETLLPERFRTEHPAHRGRFFARPGPRPMGVGLQLYGLHKDGHEFPVEISLSPLQTDTGLLVSSAIRDITDRKAMERALIESRTEAERANRAKSAFLAAASHDLRQPLQALTLLNTALGRTAQPESRAATISASIGQALASMSELLNALLDISKLEAGTVKPDIEDCSVRLIFQRLKEQFAELAATKGLQLEIDDCQDVVRTDRTLLERVVQNLLANAIRYTRHGCIQLRCLHLDTCVQIEVVDTGIGIPSNQLRLIFEEFYQVPQQAGQQREGLGLGLSIVRRVVDLLGITLEVDSQPGQGSRFTLKVPRGDVSAPSVEAKPEAIVAMHAVDRVVLVVDDDGAVADATSMLLRIEGYRTIVATCADEVRSKLVEAGLAPEAVICDYHLDGGRTGPEIVLAVREITGRPVPALIVTGDTSAAMNELQDKLQDCFVLSKPIVAQNLLAQLESVFR